MELDDVSPAQAIDIIAADAGNPGATVVRVTNVHQCMECLDNPDFRTRANTAELVLADSKVLIWVKRLLGFKKLDGLLHGAQIMDHLCRQAERSGLRVGIYGGSDEDCLKGLLGYLQQRYPELEVPFAVSPPFRPPTEEEDATYMGQIAEQRVQLLFVGIGCPKQENWMLDHRDKVDCTMIGVGAAFDILAGVTPASPAWVHRAGLEWLWRSLQDPARLGKRNLKHNPRFVWHFLLQLLGRRYT